MPYQVKKQGDKYVVYKKDTGKRVGATAGNKVALRKYLAALHLNANESIINLTETIYNKDKMKLVNLIPLREVDEDKVDLAFNLLDALAAARAEYMDRLATELEGNAFDRVKDLYDALEKELQKHQITKPPIK